MNIAYVTKTRNTERLVNKLPYPHTVFCLTDGAVPPAGQPVVLVVPSYVREDPDVVDFIIDRWRDIQGVIGVGNRNFGSNFCWAAVAAARLADVELIDTVELFGTPEEIERLSIRLKLLDDERNS